LPNLDKFKYLCVSCNETFASIAKKLGVSRQYVQQTVKEDMALKHFVEYAEAMKLSVIITDNEGHSVKLTKEDFGGK